MGDARLWLGSPGFEDQPPCGKNTYAPEGEATADIVRLFAEDHEAWQESFFNAWEKMQQNGYQQLDLTQAPDNGHPKLNGTLDLKTLDLTNPLTCHPLGICYLPGKQQPDLMAHPVKNALGICHLPGNHKPDPLKERVFGNLI